MAKRSTQTRTEPMGKTFKGSAGLSGKKPMGERTKFTRPIGSAGGRGPILHAIRVSKHAKAKGPAK